MIEFHNKKIKTFGVIVTVFIIIIIIISIYFSSKNNFFFLFIFECIVLLSYIWFGYFFDEVKLKNQHKKDFETIPKKYRNIVKQNNMERNITITLEKAREWFNGENKDLKNIALQAFSKYELTYNFKDITTFKTACEVLGLNYDVIYIVTKDIFTFSKASAAMFKLNIIRKALNLGQDLHLTKDPEDSYIYYPYNPFVTKSSTYYDDDFSSGEQKIIGKIKSEGEEYNVLGGGAPFGGSAGLGDFRSDIGVGYAGANLGFLGCANKEIAKHLGKYFGMLITEAKYGDLDGFEVIEDKYGNA